jgi:hypothetical protein
VYHWIAQQVPKIQLTNRNPLTREEKQRLAKLLASDYYIILTTNNYHLSSIMVRVLTFLKTGKWPRFSHVLMNVDFMDSPKPDKFKFMEATVVGVHYASFDEVFDCTDFCLLKPDEVDLKKYTKVIDELVENNGKPYDDLFDLLDDKSMSCVELVRDALMEIADYNKQFPNLEALIAKQKNLTPEDFYTCIDFDVVDQRRSK